MCIKYYTSFKKYIFRECMYIKDKPYEFSLSHFYYICSLVEVIGQECSELFGCDKILAGKIFCDFTRSKFNFISFCNLISYIYLSHRKPLMEMQIDFVHDIKR